ncbi:hypothetical protein GF356_05875 [candidate division GN15 bacterium]|nr:hypothetical protein [candidate division GN15 bacterium]
MSRSVWIALLFLTMCVGTMALAGAPRTISYQGRLTNDAGEPLTGSYDMTFRIYNQPTGGATLWSSGERAVDAFDGLFAYVLGSNVALPSDLVADTTLWLGIQVGSDAELVPRTALTSAAFAMRSLVADSVQSDMYVKNTGDTIEGNLSLATSGTEHVRLQTSTTGSVHLFDGSADLTAYLTSGNAGGAYGRLMNPNGQYGIGFEVWPNGSSMYLKDDTGASQFLFDTRQSGTNAFAVPEGSIHSADIANEPGIAANVDGSVTTLTSETMSDIEVVTITIPESGYILVQAKCYVQISDPSIDSVVIFYVQIDETEGGSPSYPYYQKCGFGSMPFSSMLFLPVFTQRMYGKAAGTHTFRLEGRKSSGSFVANVWDPIITAIYIPTSYGSVETFVSSADAADFESAALQPAREDDQMPDQYREPVYKVDLRELELRAARAQAEAERKRRELLEAQLREREEQALP